MRTIYDSRLLLVDDNVELCRMLTDMLRREGFPMRRRQTAAGRRCGILRRMGVWLREAGIIWFRIW